MSSSLPIDHSQIVASPHNKEDQSESCKQGADEGKGQFTDKTALCFGRVDQVSRDTSHKQRVYLHEEGGENDERGEQQTPC